MFAFIIFIAFCFLWLRYGFSTACGAMILIAMLKFW